MRLPPVKKRLKRRRRLNLGPILFLLLVVNIAAGLMYSPITSAVKIKVVGAAPWDRRRIEEVLRRLHDQPWSQVQALKTESDLLTMGQMRTADLHRNLFGRGELRLTYRVPVAVFSRPKNVGFDESGAIFTLHEDTILLPVVTPPATTWESELTVEGSWPRSRVGTLCKELREIFPGQALDVNASTMENVSLNNISGATVEFGAADNLDEKLKVLRSILTTEPDLLSTLDYLNISDPANPAKQPKKKEPAR